MDETPPKINNTTFVLMVTIAVAIDIIQFFIGLLDLITIIGGTIINVLIGSFIAMTYIVWFGAKGMFNKRTTLTLAGCVTGRYVPFLSMLPTWTGAIVYLAGREKAKKIISSVPGGQVASRIALRK